MEKKISEALAIIENDKSLNEEVKKALLLIIKSLKETYELADNAMDEALRYSQYE